MRVVGVRVLLPAPEDPAESRTADDSGVGIHGQPRLKANKPPSPRCCAGLPKFELLEHVSDVYVRASGDDLLDALVGLGMGLTSVIVRNPESVAGKEKKKISVEANGLEELVFLWLAELIYLFDAFTFLFRGFEGRIRSERGKLSIQGVAAGDTYDPLRHRPGTHVKAVTYHDMKIEAGKGRTTITVLLDI